MEEKSRINPFPNDTILNQLQFRPVVVNAPKDTPMQALTVGYIYFFSQNFKSDRSITESKLSCAFPTTLPCVSPKSSTKLTGVLTIPEGKKNLLKTLWEKGKMLATSLLSFPHNVF